MKLIDGVLDDESFLVQFPEHVLGDGRLLRRRRAAEMVEIDAEPLVDGPMDGVIFVTNFLRCQT